MCTVFGLRLLRGCGWLGIAGVFEAGDSVEAEGSTESDIQSDIQSDMHSDIGEAEDELEDEDETQRKPPLR